MKNKGLIFAGAIMAVVIILYIITTILKKKNTEKAKVTGDSSKDNGQTATSVVSHGSENTSIFPLKRGSNSEAVKYLKMAINYISAKRGTPANLILTTEANVFGAATESAVYKLYAQKIVDKTLAKRIAKDADMPEFSLAINNLN